MFDDKFVYVNVNKIIINIICFDVACFCFVFNFSIQIKMYVPRAH